MEIRRGGLPACYSDENITRYEYGQHFSNSRVDGFIDYLHEYQVFRFDLRIRTNDDPIVLSVEKACDVCQEEHLLFLENKKILLWLPPVFKSVLNDNGRIKHIQERPYSAYMREDVCFLSIPLDSAGALTISFCMFFANAEDYYRQIADAAAIEKRQVTRARWFYYSGCRDFWKYLLNGRFYNPRPDFPFESQLLANILYFYFHYLNSQTKKSLYAYLRDYTAYLTLLSLPADGRWRHGIWQADDSHYIHWTAGANVLMDFYRLSGRKIFLEKSRQILDLSIQHADSCVDHTRWFLHDSLEMPERCGTVPYDKTIQSRLLGKALTNTLALNTHIATLLSLKQLHNLTGDSQYKTAYLQGLEMVERLLQQQPANPLYSIVYGFRDLLTRLCVGRKKIRCKTIIYHYDEILKRYILPALKRKYPRLVMPNGFIERDLTFSFYNQFYHLLNMEQLLMLYKVEPSEWLRRILVKAVQYTVRSKMALYLAQSDELALTFLGVLLQYGTSIDDGFLKMLEHYTLDFVNKGYSLPSKILASPLISDINAVGTSNGSILTLVGDKPALSTVGIVLNCSSGTEAFKLESSNADLYCLEDWKGNRFSTDNAISIPGLTSFRIRLKNELKQ
ncbi:MAG: hypothetical protein LLF76_01830 [Planctomycetaceae bacterium]|nr:hypothetical protein [Planctomycetaceae bacterium]